MSHDKRCILCRQIEAAAPGNRKKGARKTDSRCFEEQDNAPDHTFQVAMTAATECGYKILPHTTYSPDMASSYLYLFPKLRSHLRGTQYGSNEGVIDAVKEYLLVGPGKGLLF